MSVSDLPGVNAGLNSTCTVLLLLGYFFIRRKNIPAHKRCMLAAVGCSVLFLASYLIYHAQAGSTPFQGQGTVRTIYFTILLTHTVLAAIIVPLVLVVLIAALRDKIDRHRRWARWTLPIWLYVSVTGVVIYWMLYHGDFS